MHSIETQFQARLQAFIDFKVKHPRLEEIDQTLMQAIRGHRTYTLRPLYGASDVGTSTVLGHVPGLLTHWRWFGEWSLGCIGVLSDWLVETVDALCKREETTFTIDALQKHALPPDLRASMEREARAGEFKMDQAKVQSEQELQRLLGNPAPVPGTAPTTTRHANGASAPKASPETHQGTHSQTRVERAAARDSVGDQVQTRNSPKCTFSGVVSIEPQRFLKSSVALLECPDCARTRSLEPRNGVLRFPAHSKCKTRTPVTSQRWAMEKPIWEVVGGERK